MQRPGPLRDIPLDRIHFADNLSHSPSFKQRPNKRPLSPNASALCSPAKRQVILDDVENTAGSRPHSVVWSPKREGVATARLEVAFTPVVVTPRKLDFGLAKSEDTPRAETAGDARRRRDSGGTASPLLSPDAMEVDDYFSPQLAPAWLGSNSAPVAVTPRDSIHYPGFDVYADCAESFALSSSSLSFRKSSVIGGTSKRTKDVDKENIPPRLKIACAAKDALEAVGLENLPVKITRFADARASSPATTTAGLDFKLKSKMDMHNLADRGQGLPWLKPGQALIDDETMEVSSLSLGDEMIGRGWED